MNFNRMLEIHYGLEDADAAKFWLIERYYKKCSKRLHREHAALLVKAKNGIREDIRKAMSTPNPFLRMLPKEGDTFAGKYIPIPIVFGEPKE